MKDTNFDRDSSTPHDLPRQDLFAAQPAPETTSMRCSLCGQPFDPSSSRVLPFCSRRCQQLDLGNWLGEKYGLPVESEASRDTNDDQFDVDDLSSEN